MKTLMMPRAAFPMMEGRVPTIHLSSPLPEIPPRQPAVDPAALVPRGSTGPMTGPAFGAQGTPVAPRGNVQSFDLTRDLTGEQPGSFGARASAGDGAVRTGQLSTRAPVAKGRSGRDPMRRLEMFGRRAWTRGDEAGALAITGQLAGLQQREMDREFQRGQTAARLGHDAMMFGLHQQAQGARDAQHRAWSQEDAAAAATGRQQEAQERRDHDVMMFGLTQGAQALDDERKRQQQQQDEQSRRDYGLKPVPVPGSDTPFFQDARGVIYTGSAPPPKGPLPEGMVPKGAVRDGVQYGPPTAAKPQKPQIQMIKNANGTDEPHQVITDPDTGEVRLRKIKIIDANGDGIPDNQQMGGAAQGQPSTRPEQTAGAGKFGTEISRLMGR